MSLTDQREKWDTRIQLVLEKNGLLNDKETEFIDSIELQRSKGRDLSSAQISWLYDLYNRLCG